MENRKNFLWELKTLNSLRKLRPYFSADHVMGRIHCRNGSGDNVRKRNIGTFATFLNTTADEALIDELPKKLE